MLPVRSDAAAPGFVSAPRKMRGAARTPSRSVASSREVSIVPARRRRSERPRNHAKASAIRGARRTARPAAGRRVPARRRRHRLRAVGLGRRLRAVGGHRGRDGPPGAAGGCAHLPHEAVRGADARRPARPVSALPEPRGRRRHAPAGGSRSRPRDPRRRPWWVGVAFGDRAGHPDRAGDGRGFIDGDRRARGSLTRDRAAPPVRPGRAVSWTCGCATAPRDDPSTCTRHASADVARDAPASGR